MADIPKMIFAFANVCLGDALGRMAIEAAKMHGGKPGPWLDAIEKAAIDGARHSHAEGITVEEEHKVLDGAIKMLQFNFHNIREELNKKPE